VPEPLNYTPVITCRSAPDPEAVAKVADVLINAKRPVIYAGQGVHYAEAYPELQEFAELLAIPVCTSLPGKSSFDETHPLSLGSGGNAYPKPVSHFLKSADVIFGIGCSFTESSFAISIPRDKVLIHSTLDPTDLAKCLPTQYGLIGDAKLTLRALLEAVRKKVSSKRDPSKVAAEIKSVEAEWMEEWLPRLTSNEKPFLPYRVLWELQKTVDVSNTIITHDAGSPRDQLMPFWKTKKQFTYIG